jgi:hypothetical protein
MTVRWSDTWSSATSEWSKKFMMPVGPHEGGSGVGGWPKVDVRVEVHVVGGEPVMADRFGGRCGRSMDWGHVVRRGGPRGGDDGSERWPVVAVGGEASTMGN